MSRVEEWLAAMPSEREVDARIEELEAELARLRLIKQLQNGPPRARSSYRNGNGGTNGHGPGTVHGNGDDSPQRGTLALEPLVVPATEAAIVNPANLSRERRDIIRIIQALPRGEAPLRIVALRMRERGYDAQDRHVGANMARMTKAGLLKRVRQGYYTVPDHVADYLRAEESDAQEVMR